MTDQEHTPTDRPQYWREEFNALFELVVRVRKLQLEDCEGSDGFQKRIAILKELIEAETKLDEYFQQMEEILEDTINDTI